MSKFIEPYAARLEDLERRERYLLTLITDRDSRDALTGAGGAAFFLCIRGVFAKDEQREEAIKQLEETLRFYEQLIEQKTQPKRRVIL